MTDLLAPADPLGIIDDVRARSAETLALASQYLDPSLVDVLSILGYDYDYTTARGSRIHDLHGREFLDFHSGEGFASLGHNHPDIRAVIKATLDADLLDGVQIQYSPLAGMLAEALTERLPRSLDAVFFGSTGAEMVDSAMKFARAATGRREIISTFGGYHGVTYGPLSIIGEDFFKEGFGPLLPGCRRVPHGDLDALEKVLKRRRAAAFIVEPIQGVGVNPPPPGYLAGAQELCRRYGTLFVLDEVQTGLARTGRWFALEHWDLEPDIITLAKALSGGFMPTGAMVTRREIFQKAVGTLERCYVQQSTYGRNRLSMAAGLATIRVIERDGLVAHAERMGARLRDGLHTLRDRYEMLADVRGMGLMWGIELAAPSTRMAKVNWHLIHAASPGLFPQLVVIPLHRDHGVITMASGKNDVVKLLPPITVSAEEIDRFLTALEAVLVDLHSSSSRNWGVVREIATTTLRRHLARRDPHANGLAPFRGTPVDTTRDDVHLVTGASGFIGGHLVKRLVAEGKQVRCLVRASSDTSRLEALGVELAPGALEDPRSLQRAVEGCDYVVHCGAMVSDWGTVEEIERTNVTGTRNLLHAAAAATASVRRLVHVSSTDVYGYPGAEAVEEAARPQGFRNWYAQTKLDAEREVLRAREELGLRTVVLRPSTVWGPGSVSVVGEIGGAIKGGYMLLVDRGRANAGLVYIDNLVDAIVLALAHGDAVGEAFNVTDGLDVTWREFTDGLADGLGAPRARLSVPYPVASGLGTVLEQSYRAVRRATRLQAPALLSRQAVHLMGIDQDFSNRKAREVLGWEPRVDYSQGMEATVAWLRDEHLIER
ncbi:MAG TPA: aminotransferase class III-fold pyridoxal phosphate-dependent enzyme [Solirubrobacteraceae bacterium]|nr:aminotransferase class III-fold pyridoxal phosphate-dependent enzyme [Solirubrobacteraceae bacterium]